MKLWNLFQCEKELEKILRGLHIVGFVKSPSLLYLYQKRTAEMFEDVRNPCHLTGKYEVAADKKCPFKTKQPKFVPRIFLSLSNYDCHIFFDTLQEMKKKTSSLVLFQRMMKHLLLLVMMFQYLLIHIIFYKVV